MNPFAKLLEALTEEDPETSKKLFLWAENPDNFGEVQHFSAELGDHVEDIVFMHLGPRIRVSLYSDLVAATAPQYMDLEQFVQATSQLLQDPRVQYRR